ncbi:MAG: ABC transporter ATP-binding protein [Anaerolineaceae bacterium]|nr:ABC transporter ATP-binding protein [Anaerolineaceae bacterium]
MKNFKLLIYLLGFLQRTSKKFLPISFLLALVQGVSPLVNIIVPKLIIDELLGDKQIQTLVLLIAVLAGANLLLKLIETTLDRARAIDLESIQLKIQENLSDKCIHLRYEDVEKKSILDLKERAQYGMYNFYDVINFFGVAARSLVTLISLVVILFRFNGWVIPILAGLTLLNTFVYRRISELRYQDSVISIPANRGFQYFTNLASDFSYGKDIRLSHCADFLQTKASQYLNQVVEIFSKENTEIGELQGVTGINVHFQAFLVYGWLAWNAIRGLLSIGDFTMYGNAARQFTQAFSALVNSLIGINGLCLHIEPYQEFIALVEAEENAVLTSPISINEKGPLTFQFDHVWFKYPDTDRDVLKDINIEISPQEKLSIVGLNGAGKTTFIKLLCRLYQPTKGTITVNGVDINSIPLDEYLRALSVVFQDFQLLGYPMDMNIAASEKPDSDRIEHTIRFFGIEEIAKALPNGIHTSVNRSLDKEGVAFSGGQMQKLAIARALYKNAPVTILDEPTSALDPRSEYEVYLNFNQLATGKTAIYISHRLSSTRFTDRIAVFRDGRIVELGTHDALMAENGLYQEMYSKQASYYQ